MQRHVRRHAKLFSLILVAAMLLTACAAPPAAQAPAAEAPAPQTPAEAATEEAATEEAATEEAATAEAATGEATAMPAEETAEAAAPSGDVVFFSTQFVPVEEQEKFRAILQEGGFDFTGTEEGPLIDAVLAGALAGSSEIDVIGTLHGTFPPLAREDAMLNMYYVPWMQATYIMAASQEALQYLPEGADTGALAWEQLGEWCKNIFDATGEARCGLPHAGLFHRFLQGYLWPSWTGGMVSNFKSEEAAAMLEWVKSSLWPYVHPQSISYEFMQEPQMSGEVWVAFDHTARLLDAFNSDPDKFVAFPAPAGCC